jgi:hypothetical protein
MEEQKVQSNVQKDTTEQRPGSLTVLCILSYIGCGIAIISSLATIGTLMGKIDLLAALVCLFGVILMWKLKKNGFYLYVIGEITPFIGGVATVGLTGLFSFAGGFMSIIAGLMMIFPILFIILYTLNFKYLK